MVEVNNPKVEGNKSYLNREKLESRKYQADIAEKCVNNNSLVVIPTGLGKTIIAVLIVAKTLELYPSTSKIILLAPTRPLINQHYNSFLSLLRIPEEKFSILTGKVVPEKRIKEFKDAQVLFYTPQTLRNDLVNRIYNLEDVCLVVFDEAHHASGDYPYTLIADEYLDQNPDGNILALTASPGASQNKINQLCDNLHIPNENIHIRTRKDEDVKKYIKPMDIFKIGVDLTNLMEKIYRTIQYSIEQRLQYLSRLNFLRVKNAHLFKKIIRKDLIKLNQELINIINGNGDKTGAYSAISINAQALILYHMLELVVQQGLDVFLKYLERVNKDAKKKNSSKAVRILATDPQLRRVFSELNSIQEYTPNQLVHPKYKILEEVLIDEIKRIPASRILVFVKLRDSVRNISQKLNKNTLLKAVRFVGQAHKSKEDKGLTQKKQIEILEQFKKGEYNVLVSTNVGEEGLDIAECDMVVFYDIVASEIRLIQRKGRTARHRDGKVVMLYCKGTNDEVYLRIALNKISKMNTNLKRSTKSKINHENQHDLQAFIQKKPIISTKKPKKTAPAILISNSFPMKFGIRKKLTENGIPFHISEKQHHLIILNKVLIDIYRPNHFSNDFRKELIQTIHQLREKYSLVITVFDFIDFAQDYEGEKRLIKREIQDFASKNEIQIISIDNPEELFFIIKNIYMQGKNEVS